MPVNEYDALMVGSKPQTNEYDELFQQSATSDKAALRSSLTAAQDTTPDRRAKVIELSERTKLPAEIVERNFDAVSRRAAVDDNEYDRLFDENPKVAQFLKNPDNAAIARDDVSTLSKLDHLLNSVRRGWIASKQQGPTRRLTQRGEYYEELYSVHQMLETGRDPKTLTLEEDRRGFRFMPRERRLELLATFGADISENVGRIVELEIEKRGIPPHPVVMRVMTAPTFGEAWAEFTKAPAEFILNVSTESAVTQAPGMIAAVPVAIAGGPLAGGLTMGAWSGMTSHGAKILSALQDEGIDLTDRDAVAAAVADKALMGRVGEKALRYGIVVGALDAISGGLAGQTLIPAKAITGTATRQLANVGVQAPIQGALGAAGEVGGTLAAGDEVQPGEVLAEFFGEFVGTPAEIAAVSGRKMIDTVVEAREARRNEAFFNALGEGVSESKTFQRLPQKMQEFIEHATADGPVEKVFVPVEAWQTYWQSQNADPKGIAAEVTGDAQAYDEALSTGADIAIPIGRYAARIAGTEHNAFFATELRLAPEQMNAREAQELEARLTAEMTAELERIRSTPATQVETGGDAVVANIEQQLIAAGMEPSTAATNAQLYRAMGTIAERAGLDPQELFGRYGLTIGRPDLEAQGQPAAGVTEFAQPQPPTNEQTREWAEQTRERLGLQAFDVWQTNQGDLRLSMVEVPREWRKRGAGSAAMEELVNYADAAGMRIVLSPALPDDRKGTTSRARLVRFYKRFGFVENKGRNKDFSISEGMYREPQAQTPEQADRRRRIAEARSRIQRVLRAANGPFADLWTSDGRRRTYRREDGGINVDLTPGETHVVHAAQGSWEFFRSVGSGDGQIEFPVKIVRSELSGERVLSWEMIAWEDEPTRGTGNATQMFIEALALAADQGVGYESELLLSESSHALHRRLEEAGVQFRRIGSALPGYALSAEEVASYDWAVVTEDVRENAQRKRAQQQQQGVPVTDNVDTFSHESPNILYQSASIRRGTETLKRYGLDPTQRYKTREVAAALEARQRDKYGTIARDDRSPEAVSKIGKWMVEEVLFELQHPERSGVGWYSEKYQRALDILAESFPELRDDQNARDTMTALIAIASDGQKVVPNFLMAADVYANFRDTGRFVTERGHIRAASIVGNLQKIQEMYDALGPQGMREYLLQERTVSELNQIAKAQGLDFSTDYQAHIKLPMAAVVFGPKLGAFYANLMGSHGYLTMDRWWSRTFNRYRGQLITAPTKVGLDRFRSLLGQPGLSDDETIAATVAHREAYEAKDFKNGTEIEKAANTIYKAAFEALEDAPFTATDRTFMVQTVRRAQGNLKRRGHEISIADIQAILWYYEKRLYGELGARQSADISYEEAAQRAVAARRDPTGRSADELLEQAESEGVGRDGARTPGAEDFPSQGLTTLEQPAFHGTPHVFDRFSLEAIGTGEGAQAYGWGLYFAENPSIAEGYRKRLSGQPTIRSLRLGSAVGYEAGEVAFASPTGRATTEAQRAAEYARAVVAETLLMREQTLRLDFEQGGIEQAHRRAKDWVNDLIDDHEGDTATIAALRKIRDGKFALEIDQPTGALYQVDIPDPAVARMLDWDAPLSEQPDAIKQALRKVDFAPDETVWPEWTGAQFYESEARTRREVGGMGWTEAQRSISEALNAAGIPGIKYLDASSRTQQTHVFDAEGNRVGVSGEAFAFINGFDNLDAALAEAQRQAQSYPGMQRLADELQAWKAKGYELREYVTRNLVVFDDAIVKITHRDGTPVTQAEREEFLQSVGMEQPARGRISFGPERQFRIDLLAKADLSTFLHETGHFYLEVMGDVVDALKARTGPVTETQQRMITDYDAALAWLGVSSRSEIGVEHHEKWARGIEAYVREGRAPSEALRPIFARFRAWLVGIYRSLTQLNVELDDEVRSVMDRLFATDEEIAAAEAEGQVAAMFTDAAAAGMSEQEFAAYRATVQAASDAARDRLQAKIMGQLQRERMQWWREERETMEAEVAAEVYARPEYVALAALQRGTAPDGSALPEGMEGIKLDRGALADTYGPEFLKGLPRPYVYAREGGIHPDQAAELFGYASGDALVQAIVRAKPMAQVIAAETDARMREKHGDMLLDGTIAEEAQSAVHNEERAKVITAELRALTRKQREVFGFIEPQRAEVEAELARERHERAYENRWREAERKLAVAIERGAQQAEIERLKAEMSARLSELQAAKREAVGALQAQARTERQERTQARREGVAMVRGSIPDLAVFTRIAQGRVSQMRVRDLQPNTYLMAARRASKAALDAAARDDYATAVAQKQRELLNLELYRAATQARDAVNSTVDYMHSFGRAKKRERLGRAGAGYLDQIDGLLERFSFARISLKTIERRKALAAWVAEKQAEGLPVDLPARLIDEAQRVNYKDMTVEELAGLRDSVRHIEHLATLKNKLLKAKAKRELDAAVDDLTSSIFANARKRRGRKIETHLPIDEGARLMEGVFASHRKLSSLAREMDGYQDGGMAWEYIVRPLNEAGDAEASMNEQATVKLHEIFKAYQGRDITALYQKSEVKAIGESLTKMGRLMIALNWGNDLNRSRIMQGYGWNEAQVQAILDTLDERDWKFVQEIWRFIDSYWPQIAQKQQRVTGVAPEKVVAAQVQTKFGEIEGGYFPLKYNDRASGKALANLDSDVAKLAQGAAYVSATTRRGHVEARAQEIDPRYKVRLDFGVIYEHLQGVIHDLSHHEILLDVSRMLGDGRVQDAIYDAYGDVVYKQLKGVLADVANGDVGAGSPFERGLNWARQGVSISAMGWSVSTSALQPLGLTQSMQRIGVKWVGRGLARWLRDASSMENSVRWIQEKSDFMRLRAKTQQREIAEIRNQVGLNTGKIGGWVDAALRTTTFDIVHKQAVTDSFFWMIGRMQLVADVPTWIGAYEKAMADPGNVDANGIVDEARATALADQAVIDSQGGGQIKDLAGVQRGTPLLKVWTAFYSYFNVTYNRNVEAFGRLRLRGPAGIGRYAVDFMLLNILPATLGMLLKEAITAGGDDDDDELMDKLVRENLSYMTGMMIGARELSSAVQGFYGYQGPAGARFFSTVSTLVKQTLQGELDAPFWRALNEGAGIILHYPAGQVRRSVEGFMALREGETSNPVALITGAPKD